MDNISLKLSNSVTTERDVIIIIRLFQLLNIASVPANIPTRNLCDLKDVLSTTNLQNFIFPYGPVLEQNAIHVYISNFKRTHCL